MKVFISYATVDLEPFNVPKIAIFLEMQHDIDRVYYWDRDCDANKSIILYMEESIHLCDIVVCVCSENSKDSGPVRQELEMAVYLNKIIVPIFKDINDVTLSLRTKRGVKFEEGNFQVFLENLYFVLTGNPLNVDEIKIEKKEVERLISKIKLEERERSIDLMAITQNLAEILDYCMLRWKAQKISNKLQDILVRLRKILGDNEAIIGRIEYWLNKLNKYEKDDKISDEHADKLINDIEDFNIFIRRKLDTDKTEGFSLKL